MSLGIWILVGLFVLMTLIYVIGDGPKWAGVSMVVIGIIAVYMILDEMLPLF